MIYPRLKTLAKIINDSGKFVATIEKGYSNTDRKISGTRLRSPGKGRTGNKLVIKDLSGQVVHTHNAAETYRCNGEVVWWMERYGMKIS